MAISLLEKDKNVAQFTKNQLSIFWLPDEPKVEKDIQDILINMTESEKHGVLTVLKLFSLYEISAGNDYWSGRFKSMFPDRIEYMKMASAFSFFEINVHLPFYNRINELLHLNTDEFYSSYVKDETLKARMDFISNVIDHPNDLYSLAVFSMVEGVILYSSLAFLKHFQSKGKNKLLNVVRGANFSVRDENLHSIGGAYAFRDKLANSNLNSEQLQELKDIIYAAARQLYEHECIINSKVFEKGHIDGVTETQLNHFAESRINLTLQQLGLESLFKVDYNPIAEWFYEGITGFQYNDFFSGIGASYSREWAETEFTWETK